MKKWIIYLLIVLIVLVGGYYLLNKEDNKKTSMTGMDNLELEITDEVVGTGAEAGVGNTVVVNYEGRLTDGTKFDSSYDLGTPFTFELGAGQVIEGWDKGLVGMKEGGKRKLVVPPSMAYGETGFPGVIPPNSTLVFEVELLDIE